MQHGTHSDRLHLNIKVQCKLGRYCVQVLSYSTKRATEVVKCQLIPTAVTWGDKAKLCIVISRERCIVESREWSQSKEGATD